MNEKTRCGEFQTRLDRLAEGTLTSEELSILERHAAECEECSILLQLHRFYSRPSSAELAAQIPDEMVDAMWRRVSGHIRTNALARNRFANLFSYRHWMAPAFSAALAVAVIINLFLFAQVRELRVREDAMLETLNRQTEMIEGIETRQARAEAIRTAEFLLQRNRLRLRSSEASITVGELRSLLEQAPPAMQIISASLAQQLISRLPRWERGRWDSALDDIDPEAGIRPREAIALLDALRLDPGEHISIAHLETMSEL